MRVVNLEPTAEYPVPTDFAPTKATSMLEEMAVAGKTAELKQLLGAGLDPKSIKEEQDFIDEVLKKQNKKPLKRQVTALATLDFLKKYTSDLAMDVIGIRNALTHKLIEIASCGDTRYELKAIELLGKHSDIGLFTERSEVNVNYSSPEALETAIRDKVKRLLHAEIIDVTPSVLDGVDVGSTRSLNNMLGKGEEASFDASMASLNAELGEF